MEALSDFQAFQQSVQQSLVAVTRSANQIASEDLGFHRSLDPSVATLLDQQNARLLALTSRLLGNAANAASNTEVVGPHLPDYDSVDGNWKGIVDVVDSLLERADTSLDEFTGAVKRLSPSREQTPTRTSQNPSRIAAALRNADIAKPQLLFDNVPTNIENGPFKPLLREKPHAIKSLKDSLFTTKTPDGSPQYPHPYQAEIDRYEYPSSVYTHAEPQPYLPFDTTTATFVDTEEALEEMLHELEKAKEIAIDLEHHDLRTYIGIVSLMQISTRERDWVVDTLQPWRRNLQSLNKVFADPKILKIFHGAHMDMIWLQRDLGLYVVGLFDTHYASRALGYPGGSLAFLLKKFINFDAQKQYQTADWRIRPLPKELFDYARSDTHFLLYIYDNMRNELIQKSDFALPNHEKDKVHDVLVKSKETALQKYQHPIYNAERGLGPMGWYKMLSRTPALLTKQQFAVFKAVHEWRDKVAREQDDSVHYIMPNHNIFTIAKDMPSEKAGLFGLIQPLSQTIRLRVDELLAVISKAKEEGKEGPEMWEALQQVESYIREIYGEDYALPRHSRSAPAPQAAAPVVSAPSAQLSAPVTNGSNLRADKSSFWGSLTRPLTAVYNRLTSPPDSRKMHTEISLSVPLPPLTAEIFADPAALPPPPSPKMAAPPAPAAMSQDEETNDVFTLKQQSRSRKRKSDVLDTASADDADLANQADEVNIGDPSASAKAARKAAKKAAKRAKRDADATTSMDMDDDANIEEAGEEADFDYAAAPSVLHANEEARRLESRSDRGGRGGRGGRDRGRGGKGKVFNPNARALDAPKGLPRAQKERAGRSQTFRK